MGIFETRRVCKLQHITPQGHGVEENGTERWVVNDVVWNYFHFCFVVKCKGPGVPVEKYPPVTMTLLISHMKREREKEKMRFNLKNLNN